MPAPSVTTADSGLGQNTVKTVFDQAALFAFRANFVHRRTADVKWTTADPPMPGNVVTFNIIGALAVATSALSETVEPTPVGLAVTQPTVTLVEYGNAVKLSGKVRATSFLGMDMAAAREVTANMEESLDIVARDVMAAGTNVLYGGTAVSRVTVAATHTMTANLIRRARAFLAGKNTPMVDGENYIAVMHPDVAYDLKVESGQQAWSAPHVYSDPAALYSGEIGRLDGVRIVENANAKMFVDAGVGGTVDVYATIVTGQQFLGEAVGIPQHVVISGPFDDLQRFKSVGWWALLGYGRIRENSAIRIETASSIGAN
jgi:N4-gp56 family major capsid protein